MLEAEAQTIEISGILGTAGMVMCVTAAASILWLAIQYICQRHRDKRKEREYREFEEKAVARMGISETGCLHRCNDTVTVKSKKAFGEYSDTDYFRNPVRLGWAVQVTGKQKKDAEAIRRFLRENRYSRDAAYARLARKLRKELGEPYGYTVRISYADTKSGTVQTRMMVISATRIAELFELS